MPGGMFRCKRSLRQLKVQSVTKRHLKAQNDTNNKVINSTPHWDPDATDVKKARVSHGVDISATRTSRISELPSEILEIIFINVYELHLHAISRVQVTQTLRLVSRAWDAQVLSTPRLWTTVLAGIRPQTTAAIYESCITRSGQLSLDVVFYPPGYGTIPDAELLQKWLITTKPITSAVRRWRSLTVYCSFSHTTWVLLSHLEMIMKNSGATLRVVHLRSTESPAYSSNFAIQPIAPLLTATISSSLKYMRLSNLLGSFVPAMIQEAAYLQHLDFGSLADYFVHPKVLASMLARMPALENLTLGNIKFEVTVFEPSDPTYTVYMPSLRTVQIARPHNGTLGLDCVSKIICSPCLEALTIMNLHDWEELAWSLTQGRDATTNEASFYSHLNTLSFTWSGNSEVEVNNTAKGEILLHQKDDPIYITLPSISHINFVDHRPNIWIQSMVQRLLVPYGKCNMPRWPALQTIKVGGHHQGLITVENVFVRVARWRHDRSDVSEIQHLLVESKWRENIPITILKQLEDSGTLVGFYHREDAWAQGDADW
jgi:hypothetical protein